MNVQEAYERGWSIMPVLEDKKPLGEWKALQTKRASESKLRTWLNADHFAYAVITGALSGIVIVDFDGEQGIATCLELGLDPHVKTGSGGFHVYLEHPGWPVQTLNSKSKRALGDRYPGMDTRSFFNGAYALVGASLGGGCSYQWLREQIKQADGADIDYSTMDELASKVPPGADGLVYCTGPTRQKTDRREGFYGNTARLKSISHRARAVMEGVLMDLFESYEILSNDDRCDYLVGGGKGLQKSRIWCQIAADLFGKPVRITGVENAVFGAALIAAHSLGPFENLEKLANTVGGVAGMAPSPEFTKFYRDEFVDDWRAAVGAR